MQRAYLEGRVDLAVAVNAGRHLALLELKLGSDHHLTAKPKRVGRGEAPVVDAAKRRAKPAAGKGTGEVKRRSPMRGAAKNTTV